MNYYPKALTGSWSRNQAKYSTGDIYMIGKVKVGSVYMATVSKGDPTIWRVAIELPGIRMKPGTTDFATEAGAKTRLENVVAAWFKWLEG